MDDTQRLRYSRHLLLQGWSEAAQTHLMASHALVIGVGGLGAPAALYLAAAGIGQLTLVDPDLVELSNLQRQIIHTHGRIGQGKAHSAAQALQALNPGVHVHALAQSANEPWLQGWLQARQHEVAARQLVVLDCTDRFDTRQAINRACWHAGAALVSASAVQWDAQITAFDPTQATSPCYACLHPPATSPEATSPDTPCGTLGVFAPLVGMAGTLQAGEAIKHLLGPEAMAGHASLVGRLCLLDARNWQTTVLHVPRREGCPVCGQPGTRQGT